MIIFDLDGTIADNEHRRHFVDPNIAYEKGLVAVGKGTKANPIKWVWKDSNKKWTPNWQEYEKACTKDRPIRQVIDLLSFILRTSKEDVCIWSGRSEAVRHETERWLFEHVPLMSWVQALKLRPLGDSTPDDILKEQWLDERIDDMGNQAMSDIFFVVDDRPKVVRMWRRRGIFVFDVNQSGKEF